MVLPAFLGISGLFLIILYFYNNTMYRKIAPLALVLHLGVGLFLVPRVPYEWDFNYFHRVAVLLVNGTMPDGSGTVAAFAAFQAVLYYVFEPATETLIIFNSLLAVLIPIPACYVARKLYPSAIRSTNGVLVLILFLPFPFFFMTLPMRDTLSVLLVISVLALVTAAFSEKQLWPVTLSAPLVGMLYLIRSELALIFLLGVAAAVTVHVVNTVIQRSVPFSALTLALAPIGAAAFVTFADFIPLEELESMRSWRAQGGAAYLEGMSYDTWWEIVLAAPVRAIYFQYAPFPTQIDSLYHLFGMVSLPILIVLTVAAYRSLVRCRTDQRLLALLIIVYFTGIIGYGLVDSNFGTSIRHRVPFEYLLVVFAAPVIERWEKSLSQRFSQRPKHPSKDDEHSGKTQELSTDM